MEEGRVTAVFMWRGKNIASDIELPLDISANELIVALNDAFKLGMDLTNMERCHLVAENPIGLLRGNKLLADFGIRDGSVIYYTG